MSPEEFKGIRIEMGYKTPTDFSTALGVSHKTIYDYENGSVPIKKPIAMLMLFLKGATKRKLKDVGFTE